MPDEAQVLPRLSSRLFSLNSEQARCKHISTLIGNSLSDNEDTPHYDSVDRSIKLLDSARPSSL